MKRAFALVCASAILLGVAAPPKKAADKPQAAAPKLSRWQQHVQQTLHDAAPGDEYFGRLKMSYLGINNTFRDESIRAGAYTTDPRVISKVSFADEALGDWARRYPRDPQLARSYFLGFQMFRKIWTREFQDRAWSTANYLVRRFPSSFFAKSLKNSLKVGFTEHYFATPVPCGVPEPLATPAPGGRRGQPTPTPSPTPSPTPTPTPTPAPGPGQPKVEILPVPCLTPTPSPTPSPTPTPTPTATPKGMTPAPSATPSPASASTATPRPGATPTPSVSPAPSASPTHRP